MTEYPWTTCGYRTAADGTLEYFSETNGLKLAQDSAIRLQNIVDILREIIAGHEAVIRRDITSDLVRRLQDASEGYCDGLAIEEDTAKAILHFVFTGTIEGDE